MPKFRVAIDKAYFPLFQQNEKAPIASGMFETWVVVATSRSAAAQEIWKRHGHRMLSLMLTFGHEPQRVSLYVSGEGAISPRSKSRNLAGRMQPITVWEKSLSETIVGGLTREAVKEGIKALENQPKEPILLHREDIERAKGVSPP